MEEIVNYMSAGSVTPVACFIVAAIAFFLGTFAQKRTVVPTTHTELVKTLTASIITEYEKLVDDSDLMERNKLYQALVRKLQYMFLFSNMASKEEFLKQCVGNRLRTLTVEDLGKS